MVHKIIFLLLCFAIHFSSQAQKSYILADLCKEKKLLEHNRTIKVKKNYDLEHLEVSEGKGEGLVWLPIKNFKSGKVTILMQGKNVLQRSFIGLAFHAKNDSTFDAVYCRPFNFYTSDSVRRIHAIQYISHPKYTWKYLRENRNAIFEKEIDNAPNPDSWFEMTIVVTKKQVKAYINADKNPSLTVDKLTKVSKGKLGIFLGDNSGGDFKKITVEEF